MKTQHYLDRIEKTEDYKKFMKSDPKAYLCSIFFVRDYEENHNETQVDFYSPKIKKIVSFKVDGKVERIPLDKKAETITHKKFIPKQLTKRIKLEIEEVKPTIIDEMHNRGMPDEIKKILSILHVMDGRTVWNCTCFLKGLGLLQAHVEDESETILFMEKKNFLDIVKFVGTGGQTSLLEKPKKESKSKKKK